MLRLPPAWTLPLEKKGDLERFQGETEEIKETWKMTGLRSLRGAASVAAPGDGDGQRRDAVRQRDWGQGQTQNHRITER